MLVSSEVLNVGHAQNSVKYSSFRRDQSFVFVLPNFGNHY